MPNDPSQRDTSEPMALDEIRRHLNTNLHDVARLPRNVAAEKVAQKATAFATTVLALAATRDFTG
ncbi:hypothetical protein [Candidatus Poriferisodalis sp.]|uniref:hypothetical protein n=1 Tax=Candidatus Poriferisodalis sp. TaxID=3101277 RepID=UPI003B01BD6A